MSSFNPAKELMVPTPFPPVDGWCVQIIDDSTGAVIEESVFDLAEDAREHAKRHVWVNKGHRAEVMNREDGETVFSTVIRFPRDLGL